MVAQLHIPLKHKRYPLTKVWYAIDRTESVQVVAIARGSSWMCFPPWRGHACISGTNRQRIWHCHRNMALRMDAANEGPPPSLSNSTCQSLQCCCFFFFIAPAPSVAHIPGHMCTHTHLDTNKDHMSPPAYISLHPSLTAPTLYFPADKVKEADIDLYSTAWISIPPSHGPLKVYSNSLGICFMVL